MTTATVQIPATGTYRIDPSGSCTAERQPDPSYTEMTLTMPRLYRGEPLRVITLHASVTDVELVTQVQLVEILCYTQAR